MRKKRAKKSAKRKASKRATKPAAKRRVAKAPKRAKKKRAIARPKAVAKQRAAKKPAARKRHVPSAPKHVARPRRTAGPTTVPTLVPRPSVPRPLASFAPEERAFGGALAGASAKERVLFELRRARATFHAAIKGLDPASAERPLADGGWCAREVVLHLVTRDQARLRELEPALRGTTPSWRGISDAAMNDLNRATLASLAHLGWDEALRLLETTRERLLEAVESVPDEPAERWSPEAPLGWMLAALPPHDRHHADAIKRWRTERGA